MKSIVRQKINAQSRQFALINQFAPRIVENLGYGKTSAVAWVNNRAVYFEYHSNNSADQVKAALFKRVEVQP